MLLCTQSTTILLECSRQVTINRTLNYIYVLHAKNIISRLIGLTETKYYRKSKEHQIFANTVLEFDAVYTFFIMADINT